MIHKQNCSTCEARNIEIIRAIGKYQMFVNENDWFELNCVQYLADVLEKIILICLSLIAHFLPVIGNRIQLIIYVFGAT